MTFLGANKRPNTQLYNYIRGIPLISERSKVGFLLELLNTLDRLHIDAVVRMHSDFGFRSSVLYLYKQPFIEYLIFSKELWVGAVFPILQCGEFSLEIKKL